MHSIANEYLSVSISSTGAELQSVKTVSSGKEHLWQGDASVWSGRAPILLPIVGALRNDQFEFNSTLFSMPRHGLARKSRFSLVNSDSTSVNFTWQSNAETLNSFPWHFSLNVSYTLSGNRLTIEYRVKNEDRSPMRFTIGSHPAFKLSGPIDQYEIAFSKQETLHRHQLNNSGLLLKTAIPYPLEDQSIPLTESIFDNDALVFKDIESDVISLRRNGIEAIRVHTGGAPHLGLWAKPAAPFVCIEPWFGYSDSVDASGKWEEKTALLSLQPDEVFSYNWAIEVVQ